MFVFAGMLPQKRGTEGAHGDGNEEGATSTHRGHAGRRAKRLDMETEGQREARLTRMRQNRARQLASETEEQWKAKLEGLRQYQTRRLASETGEHRKAKLEGLRQYQTRRLASETGEHRKARLEGLRQYQTRRLASEKEEHRKARLEGLRQYQTRRLASEKEEQRKAKLEGLRQYQTRRLARWLLNLLQDLLLAIQINNYCRAASVSERSEANNRCLFELRRYLFIYISDIYMYRTTRDCACDSVCYGRLVFGGAALLALRADRLVFAGEVLLDFSAGRISSCSSLQGCSRGRGAQKGHMGMAMRRVRLARIGATLEEGPRDLTWRQRGKERPGLRE